MRDLWPDAVDNLASAVRAGLALPEALSQLAVRGPEELRPAFAAFAEDYRATGRFQECLDRLKERLGDPVGDRLVESLRIAREVGGGDLGRLLRTLSDLPARGRADAGRAGDAARPGRSTRPAWPWPRRGSSWCCCAPARTPCRPTASPPASLVLAVGAALLARRLPAHGPRSARLPEESGVLR